MKFPYLPIYLLVCLFFATHFAFAQNTGSITGKLLDPQTKETLPFVTVTLTKAPENNIIKNLQSDNEGKFSINNLLPGTYNLRFSFLSYSPKSIVNIAISENNLVVNIGDIFLETDNKMLDEVVVEYKKPIIEVLEDKIVYNIDQTVFSEGSVATDILKNVPMVTVDIDGKATIAGRRNTRIFIDGKPSDYSANSIGELLSVLPSDALESVEVITDPSSKFDADGDGIINIVMKKGRKVGLTGNVSSRVGTLGNYNLGAFLSSKKKENFAFNANAGFSHNLRLSEATSERSNFLTDTTFYNNQSNSSERNTNGMNARFSGTYQQDSSRTLKFSLRGGFNNGNNLSNSNNFYLSEEFENKSLRTQNNNTGNRSLEYVLDADYTIKTKSRSNYSFGINFNYNDQFNDRDYSRFLYNPNGTLRGLADLQLNENNNAGNNLELSTDWDKAIKFLNLKLESGFKYTLNNSDNNQLANKFDFNTEQYEINPNLTNSFLFNQSIYAGYLSLRYSYKKWSIRASSRAELTQVSFQQKSTSNINFDPYLNLFPNVSLSKAFKNKSRIGLSYNRRVSRPRYNVLNPIIDDSDPQNLKFGNINLKPSFTDLYELSYTMFGKNWSFSPRVSYAVSSKIIERVKTVVNNNGDTETTYQNLANSSSLNLNTFANYKVDKTKNLNAGFNISKVSYNSSNNNVLNRNGIAIKTNIGMSYSFNKATAMEANINYTKNAAAQGTARGSIQTEFGFKQNFLKNRFSARLTIVDPFTQNNLVSFTQGPNFYQESFSIQRTRNFMLGLSYRYTKINSAKKK